MLIREYLNLPMYAIFRADNFVFSHFARMPDATQLSALNQALHDGHLNHPGKLVTIHIMDPEDLDVKRDSEMRAIMKKFSDDFSGKFHTAALIIVSRGFATAMLRALVSGVLAVIPRKAPTKVFSTVDEALEWVVTRFADVPDIKTELHALAAKAVRSSVPS